MAQKQTKRPRTYARNRAFSRRGREILFESDGEYLLKLIMCILAASFWIKFKSPFIWLGMTFHAIPVGLFVGLIIVSRFEHFQADRRIWYAVLIAVGIITYFYPAGIII